MSNEIDLSLTPAQAAELLPFAVHHVNVEFLRRENHSWRITADGEAFYVKAHTKPWYHGQPSPQAVRREATAHRLLAEAGLPTPEVVGSSSSCANPLGWPYLLTRELEGEALTDLLPRLPRPEAEAALHAVGEHLAAMHGITFEYPGPLTDGPPSGPPDPGQWQHWICRVERMLTHAYTVWAEDATLVSPATMDGVSGLLANQLPALAASYEPARFVHGDCHASQFFLARKENQWQVTGVVDLEIASAGSPLEDFLKLGIELAGCFGVRPLRWWEPLFDGYGSPPDVDLLRLRLLTVGHLNYACHGENSWPGTRAGIVRHLTTARTWTNLFDLERIDA
ncbi:phosphotransferase family protein [Flindersiella endophytica]